jgi:hypothetical protein
LALLPSQSEKPAAQVDPHTPAEHVGFAFGSMGQRVPHAPQFIGLTFTLISQPLLGSASQSAKFGAHEDAHTPAPHVATVPGRGEVHTRPQPPQWLTLARVSASQPVAGLPSQSAKPALHSVAHALARHTAVVFAVAGHELPQRPQCALVVASSTSQPFATLPSQLAKPAAQRSSHAPAVQAATPFAPDGQRVPHAPQLFTSELTESSHPLARSPSQFAKPALHPSPHTPLAHWAAPLAPAAQRVAHVPQLFALR